MMNDQMIAEMSIHWGGAQNLTRWPDSALRGVRISTKSKDFLANVGLPSPGRDVYAWRLAWELDLPRFDASAHLRLLGRNHGFSPFLIDESRNGCVIWRSDDDGYERYINASVEQFAASLVEMDKFSQETLRTMDETYDVALFARRIDALERNLTTIDAAALAVEEGMWRSDIFGMRLELT